MGHDSSDETASDQSNGFRVEAAAPILLAADAPVCYLPYRPRHQDVLTGTVTLYPHIASAQFIAYSRANGRAGGPGDPSPPAGDEIWVLKLTNNSVPGPKPKFFIKAQEHARELSTGRLIENYVDY